MRRISAKWSGERRRPLSRFRRGLIAGGTLLVLTSAVFAAVASAGVHATGKPTLTIGGLGVGNDFCGNQSPWLRNGTTTPWTFFYEPLIIWNANGTLSPGLAKSWTVLPGNKTIVFKLRTNARFSDGTPVDAAAVKTWIQFKAKQPGTDVQLVGSIRSVVVVSRWVLKLTVNTPSGLLASQFSNLHTWGAVASPKAVRVMLSDEKSTVFATNTFGAGPYVLDPSHSVTGDHCTYVPNKFYYDKTKIKWGKIILRQLSDQNTALSALKTGQIDVDLGADYSTARAAKSSGFTVIPSRNGEVHLFFFDLGGTIVKALGDVKVRQALNYALNRKTICGALYGPDASPTSVAFPSLNQALNAKYQNYYPYNPAKAKQLLAAAGYPNGFTFPALTVGPWAGIYNEEPLAQAMAQNFAAVGVKMDVALGMNATQFVNAAFSKTSPGAVWNASTASPWQNYNDWLSPKATFLNQHGWRDPVLVKLWLRGQRTNAKTFADIEQKILAREVTQAYAVPVCELVVYAFASKKVGGVAPQIGGAFNVVTDWYPTK
jgi:peptide/nickel transport system substrate-binding protein